MDSVKGVKCIKSLAASGSDKKIRIRLSRMHVEIYRVNSKRAIKVQTVVKMG